MGIFDRTRQLIASNFNALLDHADDPKKSIELVLDQMREQIRAARREVVRGVAAEKQLQQKVGEADAEVKRWDGRAELAVRHGDDDLAREALLHKRRAVSERDRGEALRAEQRGAALELKRELERMEAKLEELQARKGTLIAQAEQARAGGGTESLGARGGGKPFAEFRRMEDQIEGVEAALSAQREIDEVLHPKGPGGMSRDEVEARFAALEGGAVQSPGPEQSEVDQELALLKKRVRIGS
jgi:phage shock protein A